MTSKNKQTFYIIGGLLVAVGALIAIGRSPENSSAVVETPKPVGSSPASVTVIQNGGLTSEETSFDFGKISMSKGDVERVFRLKNNSSAPVTVKKMYTSCMCTTAYLSYGDFKFGPVDMPGHSAVPTINKEILPGDTLDVRVVFDPTAHGPAGVGPIERVVTIEEEGGGITQVGFAALVTP